jgi:phage shock protein PspC (stress-responsive transcriptional regulator)
MKKNISINISGIIFHIEEDGYDKLKNYLGSIHQYFSSYEESEEIIADIENRIAEIFLAKLGQNKQVITADDVQELVGTMGTVADFEAIEGDGKQTSKGQNSKQSSQQNTQYQSNFSFDEETQFEYAKEADKQDMGGKRLYRDIKRKLIAGVAAGIAHYFSIDPLWVRLTFAATFLGVFGAEIIPAIALIGYIAIWIIAPASDSLPEDAKIKKLFRNPNKQILGGVASGLAAYFGVDETIIRLLFVVGIPLGGTSVIIYLILWTITPEAKTLTEKMQMEGEPVTLSNIEKKIKESFNIADDDQENLFAKILVFPFKLIAKLFNFLTDNFKPLGNFFLELVRIFSGGVLTLGSFAMVIVLLIVLAAIFGIISVSSFSPANIDGVPLTLMRQSVPIWGIAAFVIVLLIPFFTLGLAGVAVITKRKVISGLGAWTLFGIWVGGLIAASFTIPPFVQAFQMEGSEKNVMLYKADSPSLVLGLNQENVGKEKGANVGGFVKLTIRGHDGKEMKLVKKVEARGSSQEEANQNASNITYNIAYKDSVLTFDETLLFKEGVPYRAQNVVLELFIPYNKEFVMKKELAGILNHTLSPFGYGRKDLGEQNRWIFNENGLKCLTCPDKVASADTPAKESEESEIEVDGEEASKSIEGLKDFDRVVVDKNFEVEIAQAEEFAVELHGEQKLLDKVKVTQEKGELFLTSTNGNKIMINFDHVKITVRMPKLTALQLQRSSKVNISGFSGEAIDLSLLDYAECKANIEFKNISIDMKDHAQLELEGKGNLMNATLTNRAELNSFDFEAENVNITANERSGAEVYASKTINISSSDRSQVAYKGKPKVISSLGNVKDDN